MVAMIGAVSFQINKIQHKDNMRQLTNIEKKSIRSQYFAQSVLLQFVGGTASGIILAMITKTLFAMPLCMIGLPIYLTQRGSKRQIEKMNKVFEQSHNRVIGALPRVDYYHVAMFGSAIAVDHESRRIAVIEANMNWETKLPIVFSANKIKNYQAHAPAVTTNTLIGRATLSERTQNIQNNQRNLSEARMQTGIYFYLDDLEMPKVLAVMAYEDAEKWMLLLEKLIHGTLEAKDSPQFYPKFLS